MLDCIVLFDDLDDLQSEEGEDLCKRQVNAKLFVRKNAVQQNKSRHSGRLEFVVGSFLSFVLVALPIVDDALFPLFPIEKW